MKDLNKYNTKVSPTWCPGCSNFGIFTALKQALVQLKIKPHQTVVVTDIGCSGNIADFINTYGFHALHGRALISAVGIKLANHKLPVITIIGDGGCYGEGLNHYINLMRGNHDITVLVHDNSLYSLTAGQSSPTTPKGEKTKSTPEGIIEEALNPIALALANNTTFCARGYAFNIPHLTKLIIKGIKHTGFSLIDILQPCVTLNKTQTIKQYQQKIYKLNSSFKTKNEAFKESLKTNQLGIGVFWEEKRPAYHQEDCVLQKGPLVNKAIDKINIGELAEEFV